jgi:hypothetical protein
MSLVTVASVPELLSLLIYIRNEAVCVCVCVYIYICVCVYIYACVCMYVCMNACNVFVRTYA